MERAAALHANTPGKSARWPEAAWSVPILRGLDARARAELEAAGRVRHMRAGQLAHRAGDPADALAIVTSGRFSLVAVRRGEADASVIRRVGPGDVFGEEAFCGASVVRANDARCDEDGAVCEVPVHVLRRALGRTGEGEVAARLERALRRAATQDLLRTTAFTRALPERELEVLLDAARHVQVARGEHVYRAGDPSEAAYFVAGGLLQAQTDDDGKPRVEAYLARGDLFGDAELEDRSSRGVGVVACGPAWLVAVPRDVFVVVARNHPELLAREKRVRGETNVPVKLPGAHTTAHVFQDLYRMRVARSLLVIDQESCVRCGHCAWSCGGVHDDGISRLVRRGERIVVRTEDRAEAPLLVPNSCQHCQNPACMIDCPTGAIGRDARGEVFIREELCTGCGSCAKACPWENIAMAPRAPGKAKATEKEASAANGAAAYPEVAVKCDLCSGLASGPACVAACPTESIVRIDPNASLVELAVARATRLGAKAANGARGARGELGTRAAIARRTPAWPWVMGAALAALAGPLVHVSRVASGLAAGLLLALLAAYAAVRRAPRIVARLGASRYAGRAAYVAHVALGVLSFGAVVAHAGARIPGDAGGALAIAMLVALASGAFGAAAQAVVPARLARLERKGLLPEDLAPRARELDERLFEQLSGKSELVKALYAKLLRPYRRARLGPLALIATGRTPREERARLRGRIEALLEGRGGDRTRGVEDVVRVVVEHRALRAQRVLLAALRAWVPVHVAAASVSVVLLVAHVVGALRR